MRVYCKLKMLEVQVIEGCCTWRRKEKYYSVGFDTSIASIQVEKHNNKFEGLSENEKLLYSNATPKEVVGKSIGIRNFKILISKLLKNAKSH